MKNISKTELNKIEGEISALLSDVDKGVNWSNKFLKGESQKNTNQKIKKIRRSLKKIKFAVNQNPSSALYGQSQVGKSYLIKNLLSQSGQPFTISDGQGRVYDFLIDINPDGGGVEATSIVTRFSTQVEITNSQYPIKIQLLSPKDIVLILCDSYFSDLNTHTSIPKVTDITNHIEDIQNLFDKSKREQSIFTEDDVYDIKEYIEQNFSSFTTNLLDSEYWDVVAAIIHKVEYDNWVKVFELLWGGNTHISTTFSSLIKELAKLNFTPTVYSEFKAVLKKHGTLLDVNRLKELNREPIYVDSNKNYFMPDAKIMFKGEYRDEEMVINKSYLCALIAELVFKVDKELEAEKAFLKTSDLLDFPGARSRLENPESKLSEEHISKMVLRGKVSYIFNKYSSQYLISNLLLCNNNRQIDANYIPKLLNNWIENYIGKNSEKRHQFLKDTKFPPLFIIFTFFNEDLQLDTVNDKSDDSPNKFSKKWTKRFTTIFEKEFVTENYDWHTDWTSHEKAFKNSYMLRDFHYSNTLYKGYRENKKEEGFADDISKNYMTNLRKSFVDSPFVQNHFSDPENTWERAATPNNDGSEPIIENLTKVSNNHARTHKFIRELNELSVDLKEILAPHYHSDEADKRIEQANDKGAEVQTNMDITFGKDAYAFGNFIKIFLITEGDVYTFYRKIIPQLTLVENKNINEVILIRQANKDFSITKTYEENITVLMKTYSHLKSQEAAEEYFTSRRIDLNDLFYGEANEIKNNSTALAEALRDNWFENHLVADRFKPIINLGFSVAAIENLLDNVKANFNRQGITKRIAKNIRDYVDRFDRIDVAEEMISDISASIINKFITSMASSFYNVNELDELRATSKMNDLGLNFEFEDNAFHYMDNDKMMSDLIDNIGEYEERLGQVTLDHEVIKNFPFISNMSKWRNYMRISFIASCDIPTYDPLANNQLGTLLEALEPYHFSVNENA
jgi:hypothetical protein